MGTWANFVHTVTATVVSALICISLLPQGNCQNLCQFRSSLQSPATNTWSLLENFSTSRCLQVENLGHFPNRKIIMNECSYWKNPLREQKVYMEPNPLGTLLKVDSGNEKYCVTVKNGVLHNTECRSNNFDQVWSLKPVRGQANQYLIEQNSSKKCLIPQDRRPGSTVKLTPCNSLETEQIWKICTAKAK